jgi:hypothetical protein
LPPIGCKIQSTSPRVPDAASGGFTTLALQQALIGRAERRGAGRKQCSRVAALSSISFSRFWLMTGTPRRPHRRGSCRHEKVVEPALGIPDPGRTQGGWLGARGLAAGVCWRSTAARHTPTAGQSQRRGMKRVAGWTELRRRFDDPKCKSDSQGSVERLSLKSDL